jgi:multisubunit Na+/H+ antiporter MnhF subunit
VYFDAGGVLHPVVRSAAEIMIALAFLAAFRRLVIGPNAVDRVIVLDLLAGTFLCLAALFALATGDSIWLDVALVLAVVSFTGTIALARYLEKGDEE